MSRAKRTPADRCREKLAVSLADVVAALRDGRLAPADEWGTEWAGRIVATMAKAGFDVVQLFTGSETDGTEES